jgi:hypothetical protein
VRGHTPTDRRLEGADEVCFVTCGGGRIMSVWGIEDTLDCFQQLGLEPA